MKKARIIPAFVLAYSNSDFTNPHEVVLLEKPEDCRDQFTHMGVKYTGLETCRHEATSVDLQNKCLEYKHNAHNWLNIALKERAEISEINISTHWFTGNQVRALSVRLIDEWSGKQSLVLDRVALAPDAGHRFSIAPTVATEAHIRLYYEGGISRIHFLGKTTETQMPVQNNLLEKAAILYVSDEHYGHPKMAVHGNRKEMHMVGWESARTGYGESALFKLEEETRIQKVIVDTYLHRLNAPLTCHLFGLSDYSDSDVRTLLKMAPKWKLIFENGKEVIPDDFQSYMLEERYMEEAVPNSETFSIVLHLAEDSPWQEVLPFECLQRDTYHRFSELENHGPFRYLLYLHYPNGGIHGLKVFS